MAIFGSEQICVKKRGRNWSVYLDEHLLAVVLYKKGATAIKAVLEKLLFESPRLGGAGRTPTLAEIAQWDSQKFELTFLCGKGVSLWTELRSQNFDAALEIAERKMAVGTYAWLAFSKLSRLEEHSILHKFANDPNAPKTYWPIVFSLFSDLVANPFHPLVSNISLVNDLTKGFSRLSSVQKEVVRQRITFLLTREGKADSFPRRNAPAIFEIPTFLLSDYAKQLSSDLLHSVMKQTFGRIGFYCFCPQLDELGNTMEALGRSGPLWYYLTLDFSTEPQPGYPLQKFPSEFKDDSVPCADQIDPKERRIAKQFQTPSDPEPIFDYLGCYFWDKKVGPHVVLRVGRIAECAKAFQIPFEHLLAVAWIHQFAHLLHLGILDADGQFSHRTNPEFAEIVAQWATWKTVENHTGLRDAFESLSEHMNDVYFSWELIRKCSKQEVCAYLWCLRIKAHGFLREIFERKIFNLPVDAEN